MLKIFNRKRFTKEQLAELTELTRLSVGAKFQATIVEGNTAQFDDGKKFAAQLTKLSEIIDEHKRNYVAQQLAKLGFPPNEMVSINMKTGEVIPQNAQAI